MREGIKAVIKGWRIVFYTLIGLAVGAITFITVKYILTERLVKNTGDHEPEVRRAAALKVMQPFHLPLLKRDPDKPVEFLARQPQTVRDNVIWSLERLIDEDHPKAEQAVGWLVEIARDLSGPLPTGDSETDGARLAVMRLGDRALEPLIATLKETTQRTLEREKYANRRAVAARLLGVLGDSQAVEPMIAALRDEYAGVRQQAAAALARLGTPEAESALQGYLEPLLGILDGRYQCWVRADSEGRIRRTPREGLLYGPFQIRVKPHNEATEADLQRQRDSAETILEAEAARVEKTRTALKEGRRGRIIRPNRRDAPNLVITGVTLTRSSGGAAAFTVSDPKAQPQLFDVIEGEPFELTVDLKNNGPGDIANDFFVTLYAASPLPRNNIDRPEKGEPFEGEPARDRRALAGTADARWIRTLYARDLPESTDRDDSLAQVVMSKQFNTVEADRIQALQQLMYVGHESCIPALGRSLEDPSYTVREQAALALQVILQARRTPVPAKYEIASLLLDRGALSADPVVRYHAVDALGQSDDPRSAGVLGNLLLTETEPTVRLAVIRALANKADGQASSLQPLLESTDPAVRRMVPRLLQARGDAAAAAALLRSPDREVALEVLRSANRLLSTAELTAALQLPDPRARAAAARLLATRAEPSTQPALLAALGDVDGKVRAAAATGLGKLLVASAQPSRAVVLALAKVIADEAGDYVGVAAGEQPEDPTTAATTDKSARAAAAAALVQLPDLRQVREARKAVLDAFKDTHPDVIAAVMPAVARGDLGVQVDRLIAILEDVKMPARVRQAAQLALWETESNDEESLDALVGLLNDPNEAVKTAAAVSLIGLGDRRGEKVLRDQITNLKAPDVRRQAAKLMATLPQESVDRIRGLKDEDRDGLGILTEDLYRFGSLAVNFRFLCDALVFLTERRESTADTLAQAADDQHPVLRAAAARVLSQIDDPRAAAIAVRLLADGNEFVRAAAVEAVGELGLVDQIATLRTMAVDKPDLSERVRSRATLVLLRLETGSF